MAKSFETLRKKMAPERLRRNRSEADKLIGQIALKELRRSLNLTQQELAKALKMKQASISKLEGQEDMYVSTLSRFVTALGGRLKLVAEFPDKEVTITQFEGTE